MKKLEALLFDLDGTLLDSAPDILQGMNRMLADNGRAPISLEQLKSFIGDGMMPLCKRSLEATGGVPEGDIFPYVQAFIAHYRQVKPDPSQIFPYVREALEKLKAKGVKLGVCTNKNEGPTLYLLEALDLIKYFGFVAGGDTFTVHKPNPGHILGVLEALDVSPAAAVFVGDGVNDVVAAGRANLPCIVVSHGYARDYEELGGSILIDGMDKLEAAIKELGFQY
ncbi:MAG: phosphoglycolate phosphatase [Bdellovibrionales bacterium]